MKSKFGRICSFLRGDSEISTEELLDFFEGEASESSESIGAIRAI